MNRLRPGPAVKDFWARPWTRLLGPATWGTRIRSGDRPVRLRQPDPGLVRPQQLNGCVCANDGLTAFSDPSGLLWDKVKSDAKPAYRKTKKCTKKHKNTIISVGAGRRGGRGVLGADRGRGRRPAEAKETGPSTSHGRRTVQVDSRPLCLQKAPLEWDLRPGLNLRQGDEPGVGPGERPMNSGKGDVGADGPRTYRPPDFKPDRPENFGGPGHQLGFSWRDPLTADKRIFINIRPDIVGQI